MIEIASYFWDGKCELWPMWLEWMSNVFCRNHKISGQVRWTLGKKKKDNGWGEDAFHMGIFQSLCRRRNLGVQGLRFWIWDVGPWVGCPTFQASSGKWHQWQCHPQNIPVQVLGTREWGALGTVSGTFRRLSLGSGGPSSYNHPTRYWFCLGIQNLGFGFGIHWRLIEQCHLVTLRKGRRKILVEKAVPSFWI